MNRHQRYNRSPKGHARYARYRTTEKGHMNERRSTVRHTAVRRSTRIEQIEKELSHT